MSERVTPDLESLEFVPYLDESGYISPMVAGKVGVYAIFNQDRVLQYVGYSRNVALSLSHHLVRQPDRCQWVKLYVVDRPSRTLLEDVQQAWIASNSTLPPGNGVDDALWNHPIDAKGLMTDEERSHFTSSDEAGRIKVLKQVARRVEASVLEALQARGVKMPIRFDPKLKEEGLLELK